MHANARLGTRVARQILFYIPTVATPAVRLSKEDFDAMRDVPNVGQTAKSASALPVCVGMEMNFTESLLPPN